jgi:predicted  nucleic acid-binding Zn-ribbon protein
MKEIKILEGWADNITNEARLGTPVKTIGDRPLPRPQDVQYKASRMFPDRSPEQALQLYVSKELEDNTKTDLEQNKMINIQKRENQKLKRSLQDLATELSDHEKDAANTEQEVQRLRDLSSKLKPASDIQRDTIKAGQHQLQQMVSDLEALKTKPGFDQTQYKELQNEIEKAKSGQFNKEQLTVLQKSLTDLASKQSVDNEMFKNLTQKLQSIETLSQQKVSGLESELDKKEKRFKKSLEKNAQKIASWGNRYSDIEKKIEKAEANANQVVQQLDQSNKEAQDQIDALSRLMTQFNPSSKQNVPSINQVGVTDIDDVDQDEVYQAMAEPKTITNYDSTDDIDSADADKYTDDLFQRLRNRGSKPMNEQEEFTDENDPYGTMREVRDELIPTLIKLYDRIYPGELKKWSPEQLREIIWRTVFSGLVIFGPDQMSRERVRNYLAKCRVWLRKTKPVNPDLPGVPDQLDDPQLQNKPQQSAPNRVMESLTKTYEQQLTKLTNGF